MRYINQLTALYALVLLGFLLAPFDYDCSIFSSVVKRFHEANGVQILSVTGIRSLSPAQKIYNTIASGKGFTLEVWGSPEDITQKGPARIVSYSLDKGLRNFTLGQDKKNLVMRLRTTNTDLNGRSPEIKVEDVFNSSEPQHIVVIYDYSKEKVYINSKKRAEIWGPGGRFTNWDPSYPFLLGNEATGNRPWLGSLFLVAIYNRALSESEIEQNYKAGRIQNDATKESGRVISGLVSLYLFDEKSGDMVFDRSGIVPSVDLEVLTALEITGQSFLSSPYRNFELSAKQVIDISGNIIIFIPFGFLFHRAMSSRYGSSLRISVLVFVSGALFTLCIESLQYFSLTRFSSMTDVVNNMVGTALGITIDKSRTYFAKSRVGHMQIRGKLN